MFDLKDNIAVVTGGASGIGQGIAEMLAKAGARVMICDIDEDKGTATAKSIADAGKAKVGSGIVAVVNTAADGKGALVVAVTEDLAGRFDAVKLVRLGAEALGGKGGGGRPDMAQAGGADIAQAEAAIKAAEAAIGA